MPMPTSPLSYSDCYQLFDAAVADAKGARVCKGAKAHAEHFRFRCNYARKINRDENARTYERGHPLHGRSEYDQVTLTLREDTDGLWWVYAEQIPDIESEIEPLSVTEQG